MSIWLIIKGLLVKWALSLLVFLVSYNNNNNNNVSNNDNTESFGSENEATTSGEGGGLPEGLRREKMPRHVALILDGNRRWAKQRGMTFVEGYEAGVRAINDIINVCIKFKISTLSYFVFSSENWLRPQEEIAFWLKRVERWLKDKKSSFVSQGCRVTIIGNKSLFPNSLQKVIKEIEEETKDNTKFHLILAMSYSGQNDIVQACQSIATKAVEGVLKPQDITKLLIEQELETKISDVPNPDLLIRTSGELRISNYYLWQSAYTEMYFADKHWPDFGEDELAQALRSFQQRGRRYGKI